jgi:hypothetical protein
MRYLKGNSLHFIFPAIFCIVLALLLGACTNKEQQPAKASVKNDKTKVPPYITSKWKLPITIPDGKFDKLGGWISDTQVLYISSLGQTSNLYRYHLLTGKSELIYKSEQPIVNVQISPSRKYILIHSSPSSNEGVVSIIDHNGIVKLKETIPSHELSFEWNPYNESEVLAAKFNEDWTFQVFLLDINKANIKILSLPQPFIKWLDEKNIAYLNWNQNNPALTAPLITRGLEAGPEKILFKDVVNMAAFRNLLLTITVNEHDSTKADYSFYSPEIKKIFTFSIPQLTNYSGWLIPFFDYSEKKGQFITFRPVTSGEADSYTGGFQLVSYDLHKGGSSSLILAGLENAPVEFSPSGEALLYGNSLEKIIDLKTKKLYKLIK